MRRVALLLMVVGAGICLSQTQTHGQAVTLGPWLQEGTGSVTGSGDTFTATVEAIPNPGDDFGQRNANRQRVYQLFSQAMDFATAGDEVHVYFDVTFAGPIKNLDSDFRVTLVDTSTNQGVYPISWDTGNRSGTYARSRFVDNLDGTGGGADGFEPWGGVLNDAVNGNDNLPGAGASAAPMENNGATAVGLVDGNTVSYSVMLTRGSGDTFTLTTSATEQNGNVIYEGFTSDPYGMLVGNGPDDDGFASIRGTAINSFDGIAFGIFDDDPYSNYSGDHGYTVSNICVSDTAPGVVLLSEPFDYPDGDLVGNGGWVGYGSDQSNKVQVESGQAVIRRPPGVQDVNHPFAGAPGTLYYSLEFSVDDLGAPLNPANTDFEYFATFYNGVGGDNLSARLDIVAPSGAGDFSVGIASDDGTADATWATDLTFGTTYRAVVSYDQNDNLATLWIDPVLESDTSILGTNQPTAGDIVSAVALRQATSDASETVRIDNLMVGTSFKSVVPASSALKGDVNMDGDVNFGDIPAFIAVLQNGVFQAEADCDCNLVVNFADIPAFIAILQNL